MRYGITSIISAILTCQIEYIFIYFREQIILFRGTFCEYFRCRSAVDVFTFDLYLNDINFKSVELIIVKLCNNHYIITV